MINKKKFILFSIIISLHLKQNNNYGMEGLNNSFDFKKKFYSNN